jgi:hypothetical protein
MLTIRKSQFTQMGELSFLERLRSVLRESFPEAVRAIPGAELDAEILRLVHRAEAYGLKSEQSAAIFVTTAWMLGRDFDTRFEDVQTTLKSTGLTQSQKSSWLQSFSLELLKALTN